MEDHEAAQATAGRKRGCEENVPKERGCRIDENELERLAVEHLTQEAKRRRVRAEATGPSAWMSPGIARTNTRFLNTMIASNLARNRRMELAQKVHRRRHNHTQRDRNKESGVSVRTDKEARSCGHEQQKSLAASVEERTSSHDTRRHGMDESPDKGVARTAETRKNDSIGVDD